MIKTNLDMNNKFLSDRRGLLRTFAGTAVGAAVAASPATVLAQGGTKKAKQEPLDFSKPEDNLYGFFKLFSDFSGKRTYFYQPGRIYAHRDGELPRHMMNYSGVTINEVRRINSGLYITRYRGWMLMRDPETDAVIDHWTDPWSGEVKAVRHFTTNEHGKRTHHLGGLDYPPGSDIRYNRQGKRFLLPWQVVGDDIWAPNDVFSVYTDSRGNKRYENAIHTYHGSLAELADRSTTTAASTIASQSQSPFFPWMGGTDQKGHMILTSLGRKLEQFEDIPASVRAEIEQRYPGQTTVTFPWEDHEVAV